MVMLTIGPDINNQSFSSFHHVFLLVGPLSFETRFLLTKRTLIQLVKDGINTVLHLVFGVNCKLIKVFSM